MKEDSKKITLLPCWCGGKARGTGRMLACSNRSCGTTVMQPTRNQSIERWNEIMNEITKIKQGNQL
jgi:hypothetical protein